MTDKFSLFFLMLLFPCAGFSEGPVIAKETMLQQLDTVKCIFESKYAPIEWKQRTYNWDLEAELEGAKNSINSLSNPTAKDFQRVLKKFLYSTRDYHVQVQFISTARSTLPISICGVDGRYFITYIDRDQMPSDIYPVEVGDELLEMNGRCIHKLIRDLNKNELSREESPTDAALLENLFSSREGRWGVAVPSGPAVITVQSKETRRISSYQILWDHVPELIRGPKQPGKAIFSEEKVPGFQMSHPWFDFDGWYLAPERIEPRTIGCWSSFLPPLGEIIWETESDSPFQAYIAIDEEGHCIGFLRIHTFNGGEEEAEALAEILTRFETETDILVIDQLNNAGGINMFCYALLSMLTERPLSVPRNRVCITQEEVLDAYNTLSSLRVNTSEEAQEHLGKTICGYPVSRQLVEFYLTFERFVISQWEKGKRLSDLIFLSGVDCINPHPSTRYHKPIVVLINPLCFSAADLFPAILQDNHRAILFGEKTAGACGGIRRFSFPNCLGIEWISHTTTIAERTESQPIDNIGVSPDVYCKFTMRDMQENYADYMQALRRTLTIMLMFSPK